MKKLLLVVAFVGALIVTQTIHAEAILGGLYNSVSNQLFIVNNTPPVDAKLAKSLKSALSSIQKSGGGPDVVSALKGLAAVVKVVNRTSVSNALQAPLHTTVLLVVTQYVGTGITFSNQLAALFPSAAKTTAFNSVSNLFATLSNISANGNVAAAVTALTALSKQTKTIQKAITTAQKAPAPASGVTGTIVVSGSPNFNFKAGTVVAEQTLANNFLINSTETVPAGLNTALHSFLFSFSGLVAGGNLVVVTGGEYTKATANPALNGAFDVTGGTVNVVWDPAHKSLTGTYNLTLHEEAGVRTGSASGSFNVHYL